MKDRHVARRDFAPSVINQSRPLASLPPFDPESGALNIIIETPKGSQNKYAYEPSCGLFKLKKVLPLGSVFPFDFGFIPSTRGQDGDPLDILVLMEAPAFCGCLIGARLLGVIEARQGNRGNMERNDRLIAVAEQQKNQSDLHSLSDLNSQVLDQIEHFFISYNAQSGHDFKPLRRSGPRAAKKMILAQRVH